MKSLYLEEMDITQLKKLAKDNIKYIIIALVFIISIIGFIIHVNNLDSEIAIKLINNDLLTRSIDEENYIINHKMVFNEKLLKENLDYLMKENNIDINYTVSVKENKAVISIGKERLEFEISSNYIQ